MGKHTPLYQSHVDAGARLVDFAGWDMPVHFGSQIQEHRTVRTDAGMFDVSHMAAVDIHGEDARAYLRYLWANDVAKIDAPGRALYTCMLNQRGGVIDDLIVYHVADEHYRTVVNAGTTDKDLAWMQKQTADFAVTVTHRPDLAIIAVQGPQARAKAGGAMPESLAAAAGELKPFRCATADDWLVGRTGYTGEDGFEFVLPADAAADLWSRLVDAGVRPCGLGARDTLRLEAGLNLYGQDMDEDSHPLESGLGWTVAWKPAERDFIGREALQAVRDSYDHVLVGVLLEGRGVMRAGQALRCNDAAGEGVLTSGSYAPTLECSVGFARVPQTWPADGGAAQVAIRDDWRDVRLVMPPFVKQGKICVAK